MRSVMQCLAFAVGITVAGGCGGPAPRVDEQPRGVVADTGGTAAPADSPTDIPGVAPPDSLAHPDMSSLAPAADTLPLMRLRDIVAGRAAVGQRVRVEGTCIGYSRVLAAGPQPRTRSDWQLVADSVSAWVVGPYPPGCSGAVGAPEAEVYAVTVALDTLPALGATPPRPRYYLIYTPTG